MTTSGLPGLEEGPGFTASGLLPEESALSIFLRDAVLTEILGLRVDRPRFRLQRLGGSAVLRCDEDVSSVSLALKSYDLKWIDGRQNDGEQHGLRVDLMQRELDNIRQVRAFGLDRPPIRAVRALTVNPDIGCLLIEEFVHGEDLTSTIREAVWHGRHMQLRTRLSQTACFLARLHNASPIDRRGDDQEALTYLEKVVGQLATWGVLTSEQTERLVGIARRWEVSGDLQGASEVLVHGDATPTQFLFTQDGVVAIDFERLHYSDRAADIGRIAGELKHLFALHAFDPEASEPFIQHFYQDYYRQAPGAGDFGWLTERARFHMGCSELRIARNSWEALTHRQWLVQEAERCLGR